MHLSDRIAIWLTLVSFDAAVLALISFDLAQSIQMFLDHMSSACNDEFHGMRGEIGVSLTLTLTRVSFLLFYGGSLYELYYASKPFQVCFGFLLLVRSLFWPMLLTLRHGEIRRVTRDCEVCGETFFLGKPTNLLYTDLFGMPQGVHT